MSVDRDDASMLRQLSALSRREFNMGLFAMTATLAAEINSKCQAASLAGVIDTHAHTSSVASRWRTSGATFRPMMPR